MLEKEFEELKQENLSLKTELKLQLDNIKLTINSGNNNKDTNILNSKSNNGSIKPQSTNISNISHGAVTVVEQNSDNSNLVEPPTKFSKRGGRLTGSQLLEGGCWKRGGSLFGGELQFSLKKKIKI